MPEPRCQATKNGRRCKKRKGHTGAHRASATKLNDIQWGTGQGKSGSFVPRRRG